MVLYFYREALIAGIERGALRHSPGLEDPVEFEAQVVMQTCGVMLLNDEAQPIRRRHGDVVAGLPRLLEIPFGAIGLQLF